MALKGNASDWVNRWRTGVGGAQQRYVQGVQGSADWAAAATAPAATQARGANWNAAHTSGRIDRGIQNIGTAGWRNVTVAKAGNWQTGVNTPTAIARATDGFQRLYGMLQNAQNAIGQVPRGGFQENLQRMTIHATSLHDQKVAQQGG